MKNIGLFKAIGRCAVHLAGAISLLLFLAISCLWAVSYRRSDCLNCYRCQLNGSHMQYTSVSGDSTHGKLVIAANSFDLSWFRDSLRREDGHGHTKWWTTTPSPVESNWIGFGFDSLWHRTLTTNMGSGRASGVTLVVPDWFVALLSAAVVCGWSWRIRVYRRRHRMRQGLCTNCGYDLRATPNADGPLLERCPECGGEAPASVTSG